MPPDSGPRKTRGRTPTGVSPVPTMRAWLQSRSGLVLDSADAGDLEDAGNGDGMGLVALVPL